MRLPAFLRREAPDRATLTFLPDGRVILGTPCSSTEEQRYHAARRLNGWLQEPDQALIFPWPVDVVLR